MTLSELSPSERAAYEDPDDAVGPGMRRRDLDDHDESDGEDAEVAAMRAKVFDDPEHSAQHEARMAERARNAELGQMVVAQKHEQERAWEREQLKHSAIQSAPVLPRDDDEDGWFDDDDDEYDDEPERVVTPDTVRFIDQLVQSGASAEDLAEVGEAVGHEVVQQIFDIRMAERQAAIAAHQQRVAAEQTRQHIAAEYGPEISAMTRWKEVSGSLTPQQRARGVEILEQLTVTSPEEGRAAAEMAARAVIDEDTRWSRDDFSWRLHRAMESVSPSSMLDQATGQPLYAPPAEPVDVGYIATGESDTPGGRKVLGRRLAKRAEGVMAQQAARDQEAAKSNAAGLKRARALQEKDEARGQGHRKF